MPTRAGKTRRAKVGPRFSEAANHQNPCFFREAEEILGYPQYYLAGPSNEQEIQRLPSPPQVDAEAACYTAQPTAPVPASSQPSSTSPSAPTPTPPPAEFPPSLNAPLGERFEFPAFYLTLPLIPPRTDSPPYAQPCLLLSPNTIPCQVAPRTEAREPGCLLQPAPRGPIDLTRMVANLPSLSSRTPVAPNKPPVARATERSDGPPPDPQDNSPHAYPVIIEDKQILRRALLDVGQPYNRDNQSSTSSYANAKTLSLFHGYVYRDLLCKGKEPQFGKSLKEHFGCTTDLGWLDDIIRFDYWLAYLRDHGLWQVQHPRIWQSKVRTWLGSISGVALWTSLAYAIDKDVTLHNGGKCAPSFIWIVLLMRHVLLSLPYAQDLRILDQLGRRELDPCDTAFCFLTLHRVVAQLMDTIVFRCLDVDWPKMRSRQKKVLTTCGDGHLRIATLGSNSRSQFNYEIYLNTPEGIAFINEFKQYFMHILEEIDNDCLTSLVVARCTHPPRFFF